MAEAAAQMPQGVQAPSLAPLVGATSLTLIVGLTSDVRTPMELRTFADWTMRPRLLGVKGVARVAIFGGDIRQLQIQLHPDRLAAVGLSMSDVVSRGPQRHRRARRRLHRNGCAADCAADAGPVGHAGRAGRSGL